GTLLYFGDILTFYALCGWVLLHYIDARPAQLVRALRHWWIAFAVLTVAVWFANALGRALAPPAAAGEIPLATLRRFGVYGGSGYVQQLGPRLGDYVSVQVSLVVASVPQVVGLFLLGLLAGRQGWLMHPERHPRVWRAAVRIGLAALPVAALGAWLNQQSVLTQPGDPPFIGYFLQLVGSATACLYVALFVRWREHAVMQSAMRWLAPAGRMPLTNYLLQSVLMGALLSGWGLGLGPGMSHVELAALALAIVALQWLASRAWMARLDQGPVEAWWRRATYG
ncbi:MAG TPA: DUF418 domain-containing protein, partial [Burkholderiaceae bacterium]|nr:DUF418 domain-containing protein [Burkholderiaceae bacterium]